MKSKRADVYSTPGNNDLKTKSLDGVLIRNSFPARPKKRSPLMPAYLREAVLPASALICSVTYVVAIVLFS